MLRKAMNVILMAAMLNFAIGTPLATAMQQQTADQADTKNSPFNKKNFSSQKLDNAILAEHASDRIQWKVLYSPGGKNVNIAKEMDLDVKGDNVQILFSATNLNDEWAPLENIKFDTESPTKKSGKQLRLKPYPKLDGFDELVDYAVDKKSGKKNAKKPKKSQMVRALRDHKEKLKKSKDAGFIFENETQGLESSVIVNPTEKGKWKLKIKGTSGEPFIAVALMVPLERTDADVKELQEARDQIQLTIRDAFPDYQEWSICNSCCLCKAGLYLTGVVSAIKNLAKNSAENLFKDGAREWWDALPTSTKKEIASDLVDVISGLIDIVTDALGIGGGGDDPVTAWLQDIAPSIFGVNPVCCLFEMETLLCHYIPRIVGWNWCGNPCSETDAPLPPCMDPLDGLIAWWPGNGTANDVVGDNHGSLLGGTEFALGRSQFAFELNGANAAIQIPDSPAIDVTGAITISAWVRRGSKDLHLVSKRNDQGNAGYGLVVKSDGTLTASVFGKFTHSATIEVSEDWNMVTWTYDSTSGSSLYVYDDLAGTRPSSGAIATNDDPLFIGRQGTYFSDGLIDEVVIFDRAITGDEIQDLYERGMCKPDEEFVFDSVLISSTGVLLNPQNDLRHDPGAYLIPGDFDGDGKTDFIRQEHGGWDDQEQYNAMVYFSNGDGSFRNVLMTSSGVLSNTQMDFRYDPGVKIIPGDFDGDDKTDFIRQERGGWDNDEVHTVYVYFSNGDGSFRNLLLTSTGYYTNPQAQLKHDKGTILRPGDYNGDGKTDFIRQEHADWDNDTTSSAIVYFSVGDGSFNSVLITSTGEYTDPQNALRYNPGANIIPGDYDGDGKTDFIRQEHGDWDNDTIKSIQVFYSNGDGSFHSVPLTCAGLYSSTQNHLRGDPGTNLVPGDYDGDGKTDFIRQERGGWDNDTNLSVQVFFSIGEAMFYNVALNSSGVHTDAQYQLRYDPGAVLHPGDYNGDGRTDFIRQEKGGWDDDKSLTAAVYFAPSPPSASQDDLEHLLTEEAGSESWPPVEFSTTGPVVQSETSSSHPPAPAGLKTTGTTCPVVKWCGYTYWAYSHLDNRMATTIVAYDDDGNLRQQWYRTGVRYIDEIVVNETTKTVRFIGQSDYSVDLSSTELASIPPVVEMIPVSNHPSLPVGMKTTGTSCPVVKWGGNSYWAFSYTDNRVATAIVAYNGDGRALGQWQKKGARYIEQVTVDATAETVTFVGQGGATVVMNWSELGGSGAEAVAFPVLPKVKNISR